MIIAGQKIEKLNQALISANLNMISFIFQWILGDLFIYIYGIIGLSFKLVLTLIPLFSFRFHLNLGFAFVNFTSPVAALRFYEDFNNREWSSRLSRKKTCEISVAKFQVMLIIFYHFNSIS